MTLHCFQRHQLARAQDIVPRDESPPLPLPLSHTYIPPLPRPLTSPIPHQTTTTTTNHTPTMRRLTPSPITHPRNPDGKLDLDSPCNTRSNVPPPPYVLHAAASVTARGPMR